MPRFDCSSRRMESVPKSGAEERERGRPGHVRGKLWKGAQRK